MTRAARKPRLRLYDLGGTLVVARSAREAKEHHDYDGRVRLCADSEVISLQENEDCPVYRLTARQLCAESRLGTVIYEG